MNLEKMLAGIPGFRDLIAKIKSQDEKLRQVEYQNLLLANELIDLRLARKKESGEKINVVFVCHRPPVWESLHSVFNALKADERFQVTIVAIPNKKELPGLWLNHEEYESEGAEEFWKPYGCLNGYNYETKEWLDLRSLKPDYVFFQQPYNVARPKAYQSGVVSKYARIAYVDYFSPLMYDSVYEECTPIDFLDSLSFFFTQNQDEYEELTKRFQQSVNGLCKIRNTGFPRFDEIMSYDGKPCDAWNSTESFKILWTPRWTTNEGNCNFFAFKDRMTGFCAGNPAVELVFRPHPQAFREWESTGELTKEQREEYLKCFENSNMHLDESSNYMPLLFSTDCLITDRSSILVDYFCTLKPIIYCPGKQKSQILDEYMKGMYIAHTWEELEKTVRQLMNHEDPLAETRKDIVKRYLKVGETSVAERIRQELLEDALG